MRPDSSIPKIPSNLTIMASIPEWSVDLTRWWPLRTEEKNKEEKVICAKLL
jgi:hypothetical protein